jgi:ATP-dependent DNA helicase RecG
LKTLFLSDDVETYGSGFRRVYDECKTNDVRTEYVLSREGFSFIFIRDVVNGVVNDVTNKEMSKDEQLVLRLLKENPNLTASKIAELINKNSRTIQRITNELKNKNLIERVGGTRGYWKVID